MGACMRSPAPSVREHARRAINRARERALAQQLACRDRARVAHPLGKASGGGVARRTQRAQRERSDEQSSEGGLREKRMSSGRPSAGCRAAVAAEQRWLR